MAGNSSLHGSCLPREPDGEHRPRGSYLPPEWGDQERMAVLFKALPPPQQAVAREARLNFWSTALQAWTATTGTLTFTPQEARQAFLRQNQAPLCLPDVLQHLLQEGSLAPLSSLSQPPAPASQSWGVWGARLLTLPPRWAWSKLRGGAGGPQDCELLVDVVLLQRRSSALYDEFWRRRVAPSAGDSLQQQDLLLRDPSRTRTLSELYREVGDMAEGSVAALELCVRWLSRQQLAAVQDAGGVTYVKMAQPGTTLHPDIPHTDTVELELEAACRQLQQRADELTAECAELQRRAKEALKQNNRDQAMSLLRRRKRAAASLRVQLAALDNATACTHQLTDTRVNREVIAAFRSSALALKQLVSGDSSADAAADTMDQLQQVLEECSEVGSILSSDVTGNEETDPGLLEAELSALMEEEHDDVIKALDALSIPKHDPDCSAADRESKPGAHRRLDESAASVT